MPYITLARAATTALLVGAPLCVVAQGSISKGDPFLGPINATVEELVWQSAKRPIILALSTAGRYPCTPALDASVRRVGDTVMVALLGLRTHEDCEPGVGPAFARIPLAVTPGRYLLAISRKTAVDHFTFVVSTTQLLLTPVGQARFITADTSVFWRAQPRSFLVSCGTATLPELCADLRQWLVRQPGLTQQSLPQQGRIAFPKYGGTDYTDYSLFGYDTDDALRTVRRCMTQIAAAVAKAVGVTVYVETAAGERMTAWSRGVYHEKHIETPRRVTGTGDCPE